MIVMVLAMISLMTMITINVDKMVDRNADMMRTLIECGWDSD